MVAIVCVVLGVFFLGLVLVAVESSKRDRAERGKEAKRTCRKCGETWFLDPRTAREKAPDQGEMIAAKMYRAGKRSSLLTTRAAAAELQVHNLEARAERVRQHGTCPKCGSGSFDQELVTL